MIREITTRWKGGDDDGEVNLDERGVSITNADGVHMSLEWDEYDRLVAEVEKLRPLVRDAA